MLSGLRSIGSYGLAVSKLLCFRQVVTPDGTCGEPSLANPSFRHSSGRNLNGDFPCRRLDADLNHVNKTKKSPPFHSCPPVFPILGLSEVRRRRITKMFCFRQVETPDGTCGARGAGMLTDGRVVTPDRTRAARMFCFHQGGNT